eukprot:8028525-Heterocapsa_arctica.AAC.1
MLRNIFREHSPPKLIGILQLMTKYKGHWPELYVEVCKKYKQPILRPPARLREVPSTGALAIEDLVNHTPAQVTAALAVNNEMETYENDKNYGGFTSK